MQSKGYLLANHRLVREFPIITRGLPELAAYFIQSTGYKPGSTLWQHVQPRNLAGLFSRTGRRENDANQVGADKLVGNTTGQPP
jgi:hypothetical protein